MPDGQGTETLADGSQYVRSWQDGKRHDRSADSNQLAFALILSDQVMDK